MPRLFLLIAIGLLVSAGTVDAGAEVSGKPRVLDARTLDIGGVVLRLWGLDAPDRLQTCRRGEEAWPCGLEAENALAFFIVSSWVTCLDRGRDGAGHLIARCFAGGIGGPDIGRHMVREGWALADREQTPAYVPDEAAARAARKGLWQGIFIAPALWRQGGRLPALRFRPFPREVCVTGAPSTAGVECPAFHGDDGIVYTLVGNLSGLERLARACVCGQPAELTICLQGATLMVSRVGEPGRCPRAR